VKGQPPAKCSRWSQDTRISCIICDIYEFHFHTVKCNLWQPTLEKAQGSHTLFIPSEAHQPKQCELQTELLTFLLLPLPSIAPSSPQVNMWEEQLPGRLFLCPQRGPGEGGPCFPFYLVSPIKGGKGMEMKSIQFKKITFNFLLLMSVGWFGAWQEAPDGLCNE
jgi:hypothetical protein